MDQKNYVPRVMKLAQPGWGSFTGNLGSAYFEDGVSTRPLLQLEVHSIGACVKLEDVESGDQVGLGVDINASRDIAAGATSLNRQKESDKKREDARAAKKQKTLSLKKPPASADDANKSPDMQHYEKMSSEGLEYSREQLETILDTDGPKGLQLIGERFGVADTDAVVLMGKIMDKQKRQASASAIFDPSKPIGDNKAPAADVVEVDTSKKHETPET